MNSNDIKNIAIDTNLSISMLEQSVPAGFPNPTQGEICESIDLNRELISHPASTFCARVSGTSMQGCGIDDGDLLLVDKSIEPHNGSIAICFIDGEFTLKRLSVRTDGLYLVPENPEFNEVKIDEASNFQIWGIVSYVIKHV